MRDPRISSASVHFGMVHLLVASSHVPLAFSQSAFVVGAGSCANAGAVNATARPNARSDKRTFMVLPPKVVLVVIEVSLGLPRNGADQAWPPSVKRDETDSRTPLVGPTGPRMTVFK
jgi:hypothetical protein